MTTDEALFLASFVISTVMIGVGFYALGRKFPIIRDIFRTPFIRRVAFLVVFAITIFAAMPIYGVLSAIIPSPQGAEANVQSNRATATVQPRTYSTQTPKNTPSDYFLTLTKKAHENNTCIDWEDVNQFHLGDEICIQGIAKRWYSTDYFATVVRFTENPDDFFVVDSTYIYEDFGPGSCFQAVGIIDKMGERLYMDVTDGLYYCE